jgi:bacillopeptidase F
MVVRQFIAPDEDAPPLTVTAPVDGSRTNQTALRITGTTEPGATVHAGGVQAYVNAQGRFDFVVPLDPGLNVFSVRAVDASGNIASVPLQVTFDDPSAGLQATAAQLEADLGSAQAALATAQAALATAQADLAALQADAAATDADLAGAQTNVTLALGRVATLEANLAAANARINQTSGGGGGGGAAASDPLPMVLGLLGMVLGGAALAMTAMRRGPGPKAPPPTGSAPPQESK